MFPFHLKLKTPVSVDYVLSDLSVISDPPQMKRLPEFGTKIKLDSNFISTFIKGKGVLSDVDTFSVVKNGDSCDVVIGYSSTNTNRVNIPTESETCDVDTPITFNSIFSKRLVLVLEVSTEGLFILKLMILKFQLKD